jgi:flagellar protein FlaJ
MNSKLSKISLKIYQIIPKTIAEKLSSIQNYLSKASIKISFTVYIGLMVFCSIVTGLTVFAISILFLTLAQFQIAQAIGTALLAGAMASLISFGIAYVFPSYIASTRGSAVDSNLPEVANFMSVLASSGMPPEAIFHSLARVSAEFNIQKEASTLIGEVEIGGMDLNTALKRASERSPSNQFAEMLDGIITTTHMGGDLATYLRGEADKFKRTKMSKMKRFLDNLAVIAEAYVTFMVAAPLALIVMLSVMAFIGGGASFGGFQADAILNLMTFVLMPAGIMVMILSVDSMNPQKG